MTPNFKDNAKLLSTYLLSLSLFAIAAAMIYFTMEMATVSKQIPDILQSINTTSEKIGPVVHELADIVELVPEILNEVEETRKLIPPILEEVALVRDEVGKTREQIPAVLDEVAAVRKEMPAMLASADKASDSVVAISKEIKATRPLVPTVLKEVETTRESIPAMMDRADVLIEKARVAGKEASQGAVTGLFKGIITAPFVLLGDASSRLLGLSKENADKFTEEDFEIVKALSLELINTGAIGDKKQWDNPLSKNRGSVKLLDIYTDEEALDDTEDSCRTLEIISFSKSVKISEVKRSLCMNDEGKWDFDE